MKIYYTTYSTNPGYPVIGFSADKVHPIVSKKVWCCKRAEKELRIDLIGNAFDFYPVLSNLPILWNISSEKLEPTDSEVFYSFTTICPFCREPIKVIEDNSDKKTVLRVDRRRDMW